MTMGDAAAGVRDFPVRWPRIGLRRRARPDADPILHAVDLLLPAGLTGLVGENGAGRTERLERALADYPGALLLVTHDERFAAACTSATRRIRDRRVEA